MGVEVIASVVDDRNCHDGIAVLDDVRGILAVAACERSSRRTAAGSEHIHFDWRRAVVLT